ncbi:S9 family peptidase [Amycolatopsis sp. 195334CR]|uniref:alpha/beta hydrolase family protein n=1 Tax=Amycolatopsis sp. 195334CR TaxID=2814588 RepID=UPI001A8D2E72|nr:prolyl oligopeptidase family serine peptidase [Amycolatopsis sp. 195334CR]MBN6037697.1 S9 family peptidase [Amycolatopsis sp. 195334CR]
MGTELTAELITDAATPAEPRISPDGREVAYLVGGELWLASTGSLGVRGTGLRWSPDSRWLYYVHAGELHRISPEGGEKLAGGVSDCLPLDDGRVVLVTEPPAHHRDPVVWTDPPAVNGLALLDNGEVRPLDVLPGRHVLELARRPGDDLLAVLTRATPDQDPVHPTTELHLVALETGHVEHLGETELLAHSPVWRRSGGEWRITYLANTQPIGGFAVFDADHRNLTAGQPRCPVELVPSPDGDPLVLFEEGLDTALYRLTGETFQKVLHHRGSLSALSVSSERIALLASTSYEPRNVHAGPPEGPLEQLSDTRPELRGIDWGTQERLSYQASDGLDLDGLLILPPGRTREDGPFPLITIPHGGPYGRYADELSLHWFPSAQWFAADGHAVFLPNPRGGRGHGHEFAASVAGAVGREEWTDVLTGIDLLIEQGVADPDRLGIGSWSHGGFFAAWAVGQTGRFKAALVGAGISDWGMLVATGEEGVLESGLGGGMYWTNRELPAELSPVTHAAKVTTPVLIVHGENDTNVPLSQAICYHRALRHHGVPHEFIVYPREGHRISERDHQLDLLRRMRDWFAVLRTP